MEDLNSFGFSIFHKKNGFLCRTFRLQLAPSVQPANHCLLVRKQRPLVVVANAVVVSRRSVNHRSTRSSIDNGQHAGNRAGEPAARLLGGPGAGHPADGRPASKDLRTNIFVKIFAQKPLPPCSGATRSRLPGNGAAGVYFCKFRKRKYIFLKKQK